jgi:hypothetical protein
MHSSAVNVHVNPLLVQCVMEMSMYASAGEYSTFNSVNAVDSFPLGTLIGKLPIPVARNSLLSAVWILCGRSSFSNVENSS